MTAPARTTYVCREHPDVPVTWRGTGCGVCAYERKLHDRAKAKRRATLHERAIERSTPDAVWWSW